MAFSLSYSFRRCVGALRGRTPATGYNTPTAHFRNRRCLAKMPTTLRLRCRAQARGGSLLLTFQIGRRGSRHRRPLPDRPPTLQAFRSVLSETPSVSTQRLSRLPFVPPSPRSSIPESTNMIPYQRVISQSAREEIQIFQKSRHMASLCCAARRDFEILSGFLRVRGCFRQCVAIPPRCCWRPE